MVSKWLRRSAHLENCVESDTEELPRSSCCHLVLAVARLVLCSYSQPVERRLLAADPKLSSTGVDCSSAVSMLGLTP